MKVVYLGFDESPTADNRAAALNRCTPHEAVAWHPPSYRSEEARAEAERSGIQAATQARLDELSEWADVWHLCNMDPETYGLHRGPAVFEYYGGYARMYSAYLHDWFLEHRRLVVATPELGRFLPRFHYVPMPFDVSSAKRADGWPGPAGDKLQVIQTPSRRDYKDTNVIERACAKLKDEVELTIVEGESPEAAIEAKREADIYFGSMCVGDFGDSEREAMGTGLGVVMRLQPIVKAHNPGCPIIDVGSEAELVAALRRLSRDPEYLVAVKRDTLAWAERNVSYESVAPRMAALYDYVLRGDDMDWYGPYAEDWMRVARERHGIGRFINFEEMRW